MSDDNWDENEFEATSEGFKSLRKAFDKSNADKKAADKKVADLEAKLAELSKSLTSKSLDELTRDLPANVSKFLKKDFAADGTEVSKESVEAWVKENGADFGYDPSKATTQAQETQQTQTRDRADVVDGLDEDEVPDDVRAALRTLHDFEGRKTAPARSSQEIDDLLTSLAKNPDASFKDTLDALEKAGAPIQGYTG